METTTSGWIKTPREKVSFAYENFTDCTKINLNW